MIRVRAAAVKNIRTAAAGQASRTEDKENSTADSFHRESAVLFSDGKVFLKSTFYQHFTAPCKQT